jgi:hypothetical protein
MVSCVVYSTTLPNFVPLGDVSLFFLFFRKLRDQHAADHLAIIAGELYTVEHGLTVNLILLACIAFAY